MQDPPCQSSLSLRERLSHFGRPQGLLRWDPPPESPWVENRRSLFGGHGLGSASTAYRELGSSTTTFTSSLESPQVLERIALGTPQVDSERIALGTPQVDSRGGIQATPLPQMRDGRSTSSAPLDTPDREEDLTSVGDTVQYPPSSTYAVQQQPIASGLYSASPEMTIARLRAFASELQQKLERDSALSADLRRRAAFLEDDGKKIEGVVEALEQRIAGYGSMRVDPELQGQLRNEDARGTQLRRRIAQLECDREQAHRRIQSLQRQNMEFYQTIQDLMNRGVTVP